MACLIIGDSLAVGVGQFRPECETAAKVGITSQTYLATWFPAQGVAADTVVISLGVNDGDTSGTLDNLQSLRARVAARSVYWLLPGLKEDVRRAIGRVAAEYGDRLIDTRPEVGPDHLHPSGAGYQRLAAQTGGDRRADLEVAYAPQELRASPVLGHNYPARVRASSSLRDGPATPRERIRRLKALRSADTGAPLARHARSQRNTHVTTTLHRVVYAPAAHCAAPGRACRSSVKSAAHGADWEFAKRERIQARTIASQR